MLKLAFNLYEMDPWSHFKIDQKYKVHFKHKTRTVNKVKGSSANKKRTKKI